MIFKDGHHPIVIFCDGACSGNPGPGGWASIVVTPDGQVRELGGSAPGTTNNQMELTAAIRGLAAVANHPGPVQIYTDSVYVIRGITQWIWGWRKRGWKTAEDQEVANRTFWEDLDLVLSRRGRRGDVSWHYVRGHNGVPGNERVDEIAVAFTKSRGQSVKLYQGPLLQYPVAIFDIPEDTSLPPPSSSSSSSSSSSRGKSEVYYLSLVDGLLQRHKTWAECQARTNGRSRARYKKIESPKDEADTLAKWGLPSSSSAP